MEKEKELSVVISDPVQGNFLKEISWNKEEFRKKVSEIAARYDGLTYTEDQIKAAKADRASLNAMKKAISDRRIEVKNAVMTPYTKFETEVKEIVELIDEPIGMIDRQIKEYEARVKQEKKQKLQAHFSETVGDMAEILRFDMIYDSRWLNTSVSYKKACEEMDDKIGWFRRDMHTIETMCADKYQSIAKDSYMKNMDISKALEEANRIMELDRKREDARQIREEKLKRAAEERVAEEKATKPTVSSDVVNTQSSETTEKESLADAGLKDDGNKVFEQKDNPVPQDPFEQAQEKLYKTSFTVVGTRDQIIALKKYMIGNGIKFGKAE